MSCTKNRDTRPDGHLSCLIDAYRDGYGYMTTDRARDKVRRGQGRQRAYRTRIDQVAQLQLQLPSASSKIWIRASSFLRAAVRPQSAWCTPRPKIRRLTAPSAKIPKIMPGIILRLRACAVPKTPKTPKSRRRRRSTQKLDADQQSIQAGERSRCGLGSYQVVPSIRKHASIIWQAIGMACAAQICC